MTVRQVAQYLQCSKRHVREVLIGKGKVRYTRLSGNSGPYRIFRDSLIPTKRVRHQSPLSAGEAAQAAAARAGLSPPGLPHGS